MSNLRIEGMAVEDGPWLRAHSDAFALHPKWPPPAITPDVPFCAVATMMQPSFWRLFRRPIRCGRRHPQHRLPSAVPHAVRPALAASRACSCCCAQALRGHPVGRLLRLHASNVDPGRRTRHNGCVRQAVGDTGHVKAVVARRYHKVKPFTWCDPLGGHDVAT